MVFALLGAIGAHWLLLQSVAWTSMLADNLRTSSLTEAVQRTFDGRHPCALCQQIAAGKKSEKRTEFPLTLQKFEFVNATTRFVFAAPADFYLLPQAYPSAESVSRTPPTPPPRLALG